MKISAVIICFNEESNIGECVKSAQHCCEEIIVVDTGSTDATIQNAGQTGARVYEIKWQGYGQARNLGAAKAKHDWILVLDADERVSDQLKGEIAALEPEMDTLFQLQRLSHFMGQWIYNGHLFPEWKPRIYNRRFARWDHSPVHEQLESIGTAKMQRLRSRIYHFLPDEKDIWRSKFRRYGHLGALKWKERGYAPGWIKRKFGPAFHFFRSFVLQFAFLEGKAGYDLARQLYFANREKIRAFGKLQ